MPWLSILMAIISFLGSLKKDKSNVGQAALVGAAAGLGTYYVTHETEWGQTNLGQYDGVVTPGTTTTTTPTTSPTTGGGAITVPKTNGSGSTGSIWTPITDNLLPIATGAAAGLAVGSTSGSSTWLWLAIGLGAILLLK